MTLRTVPPLLTTVLFQQLYDQHAGQLCAYLTKNLRGDRAEAEGIVQESFLKAWEKRADLRKMEAFRSWIYTIAINVLRQRKRKLRPLASDELDPACERPGPERQLSDSQNLDRVMTALDQLPAEQREAVLMVRMDGMKFRQAADILGISENTVKTRVRRGLLKLAEALDM